MSRLLYKVRQRVPGFKLRSKQDSRFVKLLYLASFMFIWNRRFMTGYITTIGKTVYVPGSVEDFGSSTGDLVVLKHEMQHMLDSIEEGVVWWSLKYLFPQVLAPLCFLGLVWWPLWFIALALGPWPAPWRVRAEVRGYAVTAYEWARRSGRMYIVGVDRYQKYFTSWAYYRMAWRWRPVRAALLRRATELLNAGGSADG